MAGLSAPLRPSPPSSSHSFTFRLLLLLIVLPRSLRFHSTMAWRPGRSDLQMAWRQRLEIPRHGQRQPLSTHVHFSSSFDCVVLLGHGSSPSFPYYRWWKFDIESYLRPKKPELAGLAEFLKPLNEVVMKANALTEGRRPDFFNHLKTSADSLAALFWIAYTGKDCGMSLPIAHVEESWQMAEFYNNKILVEYKNKDPDHVEWAKALKELYLPGLRDYVKSFHPLGPVWNPTGRTTISATTSARSKTPSSGTPAPPPPPRASLLSADVAPSRPKEGMAAVFQEISSGKPVTSGLRKVTNDMKTKNRSDRSGVVSGSEKEARTSSPSFSKAGPPKLELQMGRKWVVENQIGRKNLVIDDCDSKQSVYVFGCKDSVLQIKGKVNNITIDKCSKMGIVFSDVVAACEIVNCNGVEVQCQGSAPTISVDNTGGCQLYLSKDSLGTSITTAKSSEINVLVPSEGPDGDWGEHALPQQYVHVFKDGQFVTSPLTHSGG